MDQEKPVTHVLVYSAGIVTGMVLCAVLARPRDGARNVDQWASARTARVMAAREAQALEAARAPRVIGMTDTELALWAERHGRAN